MSAIRERYLRLTPRSADLQRKAQRSIPSGTSRAAGHWFPHPITIESAGGAYVTDVDGRTYVDLINNYTALVHGHGHPPILDAVRRQLERGTCWSGSNVWQHELTQERIDRMDRLARGLEERLLGAARTVGVPLSINRSGSLLNLFFSETTPPATLIREDHEAITLFHLGSLNHGLLFAGRGLMALSTPMDEAVIDEIAERSELAMRDVAHEAFGASR